MYNQSINMYNRAIRQHCRARHAVVHADSAAHDVDGFRAEGHVGRGYLSFPGFRDVRIGHHKPAFSLSEPVHVLQDLLVRLLRRLRVECGGLGLARPLRTVNALEVSTNLS